MESKQNFIDIKDDKEYKELKKIYITNIKTKRKDETFIYRGNEMLIGFAKYLLQYIEQKRSDVGLRIFGLQEGSGTFVVKKLTDDYKAKDEVWRRKNGMGMP